MSTPKDTNLPAAKGEAIQVSARGDSFRRCGREFGREPVIIPAGELTEQELARLRAEPMLIVTTAPAEA